MVKIKVAFGILAKLVRTIELMVLLWSKCRVSEESCSLWWLRLADFGHKSKTAQGAKDLRASAQTVATVKGVMLVWFSRRKDFNIAMYCCSNAWNIFKSFCFLSFQRPSDQKSRHHFHFVCNWIFVPETNFSFLCLQKSQKSQKRFKCFFKIKQETEHEWNFR